MQGLLRVHFTILLLNILVVSCIFYTKYENIGRSNVLDSNYGNAVGFVDGFLITSEVFLSVQILLLILGLPFTKQLLALQILFQLLGVVLYGLFILLRMPYQTISYIWGVFCLLPFLINIASVIYRTVGFRKYEALRQMKDVKMRGKREGKGRDRDARSGNGEFERI